MSEQPDDEIGEIPRHGEGRDGGVDGGGIDDVPVVTCSRCDREWSLGYELDELCAGNGAVEQFALDHGRHTGHYPDGVTPWIATCRRCPAGESFITETPARRWARTHARHTRHVVEIEHGIEHVDTVPEPETE